MRRTGILHNELYVGRLVRNKQRYVKRRELDEVKRKLNLAEVYRRKVSQLRETLADLATMTEAMEILRGLIERVSVRRVTEGFEVELVGEIANMVQLSAGVESWAKEPYRSSVKVVAGVGFEPTTFRL